MRQTLLDMATQEDIREICSRLPGSLEGRDQFGFSVLVKGKAKGFVWSWRERTDPKKPRIINDAVVAIVVPNGVAKQAILDSDPDKYFTEPHYDGFNAVLVRLESVSHDEIEDLLIEAWKCKAPKALLEAYLADHQE
ncbi:MAG TPA: hypothetical protein PKA27_15875 [Fimbriimonadaceae bacterium]|nr:hypothetical protein [Fimbriimonadaceae bacterium]